jgi:phosphorylcholine metabolism protein LicD
MVNLPSSKSWKKEFVLDYGRKFKKSREEYDTYKDSGDIQIIYLQQACEKLFSVVENYLMVKYSRRKRYSDLLKYLNNVNIYDAGLLADSKQLHIFFYNGEIDIDRYTIDIVFKNIYENMKKRLGAN